MRKYDRTAWLSEVHASTGRSLIRHMLGNTKIGRVFMPAYVPEGVIDPVCDAGLEIVFYRLQADLTPDVDSIMAGLRAHDLVIVIHYLGMISLTERLRERCDQIGAVLFEDCAHAYWHAAEHAHVALYTLNKVFPVVDGAILRSRIHIGLGWETRQPPNIGALMHYLAHMRLNQAVDNAPGAKEAAVHMAGSYAEYEKYYRLIKDDYTLRESSQKELMVPAAEHASIRARNTLNWYMDLPSHYRLTGIRVGNVPLFAYPVICPDGMRNQVAVMLNEAGIAPSTLIEKWDHLGLSPLDHGIERQFMDNHILLPVDPGVTPDDIRRGAVALGSKETCQ